MPAEAERKDLGLGGRRVWPEMRVREDSWCRKKIQQGVKKRRWCRKDKSELKQKTVAEEAELSQRRHQYGTVERELGQQSEKTVAGTEPREAEQS